MFLGSLSSSEQRVFARLADAVIRADGELHDKELALQARLAPFADDAAVAGAGGDVLIPEGAFETAPARAALLLELCLLAYADGSVSTQERELLDQVAEGLGASRRRIDRMLDYAAELSEVLDRGVELQAEGLA